MFRIFRPLIKQATLQHITRICQCRRVSATSKVFGIFEPDNLNLPPDIPEYEEVQIQLKGYDFVVLESFSKYVHSIAREMQLESDTWASPPQVFTIKTFKPNSTVVENAFDLKEYSRTVQLDDVPSPTLPILVELISTHAPEGVNIVVKKPDEEDEEFRYIPELEKKELKSQIEAIEQARADRRK
ncbi:hypothetical protein SNE40_009532 [Patella caerulea]|uniref:Small ribosomal subunit protein uS10 domain-containing protein n=1 Tax=Patella caerulea TaxID=87958 RepID=A0AAN8PRY0_PATCE